MMENNECSWWNRIPWKKNFSFFIFGLILLLLYVSLANFKQVIRILSNTNPLLLVLAILSIILSVLLYTLAWQKLLILVGLPTPYTRTLFYQFIGVFFDIVVPSAGSAGIAARAYLIRDEHKAFDDKDIWGRTLTSQAALKIFITLWSTIAGIFSFTYLLLRFPLTRYTTLALLIFLLISVLGTTVLLWITIHPTAPIRIAHGVLNGIIRVFPFTQIRVEEFRPKAEVNARSFSRSMRILVRQKKVLLILLTFSYLYYLARIIAVWLSFKALGFQQPILVICAVATVALIIESLGVGLPGGLGVKEIVTTELFTVVFAGSHHFLGGITFKAAATAASIMVNVLMFWVPLGLSSLVAFKAIPLLRKAMHSMTEMNNQVGDQSVIEINV